MLSSLLAIRGCGQRLSVISFLGKMHNFGHFLKEMLASLTGSSSVKFGKHWPIVGDNVVKF